MRISTATFLLLLVVAGFARAQTARDSMIDPSAYRGLTADRRAHRIGEALTVIVLQSTTASATANTDANNSVRLGVSAQDGLANYGGKLGISGQDKGLGRTSRSGVVQAQLSVRIIGIGTHGMLQIRGSQEMTVNGETQRIQLSGWVRPEDISAANTVISSRISDARIQFTGQGDVSAAQRHSIIYRFTRWLGLI